MPRSLSYSERQHLHGGMELISVAIFDSVRWEDRMSMTSSKRSNLDGSTSQVRQLFESLLTKPIGTCLVHDLRI